MTLMAVAAASAVWLAWRGPEARWAGAGVATALLAPQLAAAAMTAGAALLLRARLRRRREQLDGASADVPMLAELIQLGLLAGMSPAQAIAASADHVAAPLRAEARGVLHRSQAHGLTAALAATSGLGRSLWLHMARAATTGAPLSGTLSGFVTQLRREEIAQRRAAARRLPVKLLVPVTLLILPGFVLLTLGPAVLGALSRLRL